MPFVPVLLEHVRVDIAEVAAFLPVTKFIAIDSLHYEQFLLRTAVRQALRTLPRLSNEPYNVKESLALTRVNSEMRYVRTRQRMCGRQP